MSGNALNFRVNVEAEELNKLNKSVDGLRKNFTDLGKDANSSMSSVEKSMSRMNTVRAKSVQQSKEVFSTNKKYYDLLRKNVRTVESAEKKIKALESAKRKLSTTSKHYQTNLNAINAEIRRTNTFLDKNRKAQMGVAKAQNMAAISTKNQNQALNKQSAIFTRNTGLAQQFQNQIVGLTSIYAMERFLGTLIKIRGEFEIQNVALSAMLQNKALADRMFLEVQDLALKSPFKILELNKSLKQLKAYRIENENLVGTLGMLGDISAGLGVQMDRLILAFGQIKATGWLRGTELRQLTEAGINVLDPLVGKFEELGEVGITTADVMKKIENRMVSFDMVSEVFEDLTSKGGIFYEQQIKQAETLQGKVSILTDALHKMLNEIGTNNEGVLKGGVDTLTSMVNNVEVLKTALLGLVATYGAYRVAMMFALGTQTKMLTNFRMMGAVLSSPIKHLKMMRAANLGLIASNKKVIASNTAVATSGKASVLHYKHGAVTAKKLAVSNSMLAQSNLRVAATSKTVAISAKAMKLAMGGLIAVAGLVVTSLITYFEKQKEFADKADEYRDQTDKQVMSLRELEAILESNTSTLKERNTMLKKAKELNSDIVGSLNAEGRATDELTASINSQIEALKQRAKIQAIYGEDYLKKIAEVEDAESDAAKAAAKLNKTLLDLLKGVERVSTEDATKDLYKIFFDEDLSIGAKLMNLTKEINKNLSEANVSPEVKKVLEEYGSFRGAYEGNEQFDFDPSIYTGGVFEQGAPFAEQASLEATSAAQRKIQEIFESFVLFARNAGNNAEGAAAASGENAAVAYSTAFADRFGSMVEDEIIFGKDVISYISDSIFPENWEEYKNDYVKQYFDFYGKEVAQNSQEWVDQLERDSNAQRWSLNKFLVEQYGIGDPAVLQKETRIWAMTVKDMISAAQDDISDFRENSTGQLGIQQPVRTQNIEAYRKTVSEILDDTKSKMEGLSKAAENDQEINKDLNKLYQNRLKTFTQIARYLGIFEKSKGAKTTFKVGDYTQGLEDLLKALRSFKSETERLQTDVAGAVNLGGVDELVAGSKLIGGVADKFANTFYEEVFQAFGGVSNDYKLFGANVFDNITKEASLTFAESLKEAKTSPELVAAVQEYFDVLTDTGTLTTAVRAVAPSTSDAEIKRIQDTLTSNFQPKINEILGTEIDLSEWNRLVEFREEWLSQSVVIGDSLAYQLNESTKSFADELDELADNYEKFAKELEEKGVPLSDTQKAQGREIFEQRTGEEVKKAGEAARKLAEANVGAELGVYEKFLKNVGGATLNQMRKVQEILNDMNFAQVSDFVDAEALVSLDKAGVKLSELGVHGNDGAEGLKELTDVEFENKMKEVSDALFDQQEKDGSAPIDVANILLAITKMREYNVQLDKTRQESNELFAEKRFGEFLAFVGSASEGFNELSETLGGIDESFGSMSDRMRSALGVSKQMTDAMRTVSSISGALGQLGEMGQKLAKNLDTSAFVKTAEDGTKSIAINAKSIAKSVEGMSKLDAGAAILDGVIGLTTMIVDAWAQRKEAAKQYYLSVQNFQSKERVNSVAYIRDARGENESIFIDDWQSELRAGVDAAALAEEEMQDIISRLAESGEVKVGTADKASLRNTLKGAGAGAAIGAGVGTLILPGVGTAIGAGVGAVAGGLTGLLAGKESKDEMAALFETYPELIDYTSGVAMLDSAMAENLVSAGLVKDETALWLQEGIDMTEEYEAALEQVNGVIEDLSGNVADNLREALVDSFIDGSYAADKFRDSLEGILETMISTSIFNATFGTLFQKFEEDIKNALITDNTSDEMQVMQRLFEDANTLVPTFDALMSNAATMADNFNFDLFQKSVDDLGQLESGIQGMQEDTANILVGQFNSMRDALWRIHDVVSSDSAIPDMNQAIASGLMELAEIRINTGLTAAAAQGALDILTAVSSQGNPKGFNIN